MPIGAVPHTPAWLIPPGFVDLPLPAPPVVALKNDFDTGQASGTNITGANSGAVGDNAFDSTVSTPTYDNSRVHSGSLSMAVAPGGTRQVVWSTKLGLQTIVYGRLYFYIDSVQGFRIAQGDGNSTLNFWRVSMNTATGTLGVNINGGASTNSVNAMALSQWVRVEYMYALNGATATVTAQLFNSPESLTPDDTITATGATTETSIAAIRIGAGSSITPTVWFDDFAASNTQWIGPTPIVPVTVSPPVATAAASAPVPGVAVQVSAPVATASASAPVPAVPTIAPPAASAAASSPIPAVQVLVTAPPVPPLPDLFDGDWSTGDLSQYLNYQTQSSGGTIFNKPSLDPLSQLATVTSSICNFVLPDQANDRNELLPSLVATEGSDWWIGYWVKLGQTVNVATGRGFQTFGQFHQGPDPGTGRWMASPPVAHSLQAVDPPIWVLHNGQTTGSFTQDSQSGPSVVLDKWTHVLFHIVFSFDLAVGTVDWWIDGTQYATAWKPANGTLYSDGQVTPHIGFHRADPQPPADVKYFGYRIATTRSLVDLPGPIASANAPLAAIQLQIAPAAASAAASALVPSVIASAFVSAPVATASASAPTPVVQLQVSPAAATASASAPVPAVTAGQTIAPPAATASASSLLPGTVQLQVPPPVASASAAAPIPGVQVSIPVPVASETASAPTPSVAAATIILPPAATASASSLLPAVKLSIAALAATASASSLLPQFGVTIILPGAGTANASAKPVSISLVVSAPSATAAAAMFTPFVFAGTPVIVTTPFQDSPTSGAFQDTVTSGRFG